MNDISLCGSALIVFIILFSRGLLQLFFSTSSASAIQATFLGLVFILLGYNKKISKRILIVACILFVISFASLVHTFFYEENVCFNYLNVIIFTILTILICNSITFKDGKKVYIYYGLALSALYLIFIAALQQSNFWGNELPGGTTGFYIKRPQSVTGSYLHYPIIISIISLVSLSIYCRYGKIFDMILYLVFASSVFLSLSRNGMFILTLGSFFLLLKKYKQKKIIAATMLFIIAIFAIKSTNQENIFNSISSRFIGALNTKSEGNDKRIELWEHGMHQITLTNILIGTKFGLVTNTASEELKEKYGIIESSIIQQILNIGLLGTILYYYLLYLHGYKQREYNQKVMASVLLLSTIFYQSIEIIPFISLYNFLPCMELKKQ